MKLSMLTRIIVLVAFLGTNYLKADEGKTITLKDLQGRELLCEIVTKTDSSVTVSNTNGQEFEIPLDKLDSKSRSLIADWSDPTLELFNLLNTNVIKLTVSQHYYKKSMLFWNLAKEYGIYTEFGDEGVPECKLSFASVLFAFQDFSKDRITGALLYTHYSPGNLRSDVFPGKTATPTFAKLMMNTIQEWPTGLPYYLLDDFKNLQRALYDNQQDILQRILDAGGISVESKFYISQDVRKYSKRIVNVLKPYQNKLGLPY